MFTLFIIPLLIYVTIDVFKFHRRNKYILQTKKLVYLHEREHAKIKVYEILGVLILTIAIVIFATNYSGLWIVAFLIFQMAREKFMLSQNIVLFQDGMLFDMTYILWEDVYKVKRTNNKSLTIESYNFALGEFKIDNLEDVDELELKMKNLIGQ